MELTKTETLQVYYLLQEKLDDLREVGADAEEYAEVEALFQKVDAHRY